jgi:hypothetical protein
VAVHVDIVFLEDRQRRNGVANCVVGRVQGLQSQVIAGGGLQLGMAESRYFRHLLHPHVGAHGDDAGQQGSGISLTR